MANSDWSQGEPQQPPQQRKGVNWFLIIIAIVAFLAIKNSAAQREQAPAPPVERPRAPAPSDRVRIPPATPPRPSDPQQDGDWTLEDVPVRQPTGGQTPTTPTAPGGADAPAAAGPPADPKKTSQGDWEVEEMPATGATTTEPTSPNPVENPPAPRQPTTEGDWSIEDLDAK